MDGAWAMYEAWLRLHHGDIDIAVVTGSGRSSTANPSLIYPMEMDPYYLAPLGVDPFSFAALQARALIDAGKITERDMAEVAARSRRDGKSNPHAQVTGDFDVDKLLEEDYVRAPLRRHDLPPISDGACAVVLATARRARGAPRASRVDHRARPPHRVPQPGAARPHRLAVDPHRRARPRARRRADRRSPSCRPPSPTRSSCSARCSGSTTRCPVNPSGGALAANPIMATGLVRISEAARHIVEGDKQRTLAHSTSGPCLQQNLVCILEGDS